MRSTGKMLLLALLMYVPFTVFAQPSKLACPFERGSGREPKEAYSWEPRDEKVIMVSRIDTLIRSALTGTVSNVSMTEDNKYEIVIYQKNYYIWYYGVTKPLVKKNQNVTAGQNIGTYTIGSELEFRMYKDEQQLDPRNLLECKIPRADE